MKRFLLFVLIFASLCVRGQDIDVYLKKQAEAVNARTPLRVNDHTLLRAMRYENRLVVTEYVVDGDMAGQAGGEEFRKNMLDYFLSVHTAELMHIMAHDKISMKYMVFDPEGKLRSEIEISPEDYLKRMAGKAPANNAYSKNEALGLLEKILLGRLPFEEVKKEIVNCRYMGNPSFQENYTVVREKEGVVARFFENSGVFISLLGGTKFPYFVKVSVSFVKDDLYDSIVEDMRKSYSYAGGVYERNGICCSLQKVRGLNTLTFSIKND